MSARVVHFEVPFDDADRARSFYADVFDWQIQPMPEMNYNVSTAVRDVDAECRPGHRGGMMQRQCTGPAGPGRSRPMHGASPSRRRRCAVRRERCFAT